MAAELTQAERVFIEKLETLDMSHLLNGLCSHAQQYGKEMGGIQVPLVEGLHAGNAMLRTREEIERRLRLSTAS